MEPKKNPPAAAASTVVVPAPAPGQPLTITITITITTTPGPIAPPIRVPRLPGDDTGNTSGPP
jgi:hypothetical protein